MDVNELKIAAQYRSRGKVYDEFEIGESIHHHWGRTITEVDAFEFFHLTLSDNPLYFNTAQMIQNGAL